MILRSIFRFWEAKKCATHIFHEQQTHSRRSVLSTATFSPPELARQRRGRRTALWRSFRRGVAREGVYSPLFFSARDLIPAAEIPQMKVK